MAQFEYTIGTGTNVDEEEIRAELEDEYSGDELEEQINQRISEKVLQSIEELQNVDFNI